MSTKGREESSSSSTWDNIKLDGRGVHVSKGEASEGG